MAVLEITTYGLSGNVDDAVFLDADKRFQTEVLYHHAGLIRRTTARAPGGEWVEVVLWRSADDAEASQHLAADHPVTRAYMALVDGSTVRSVRYVTLD